MKHKKLFEKFNVSQDNLSEDHNELSYELQERIAEITEVIDYKSDGQENDAKIDYERTRNALLNGIDKGQEILLEALKSIVKDDATPRAVEAATMALKTLSESANAVMDLHAKMKRLTEKNKVETKTESGKKGTLMSIIKNS
jgi:hypothetical protein